jgi:hypothetical protein
LTQFSLRESRKRAYKFILDQSKEANIDLGSPEFLQGTSIPLEELEDLKLGLADPSRGLVESCRRIFGEHVGPSILQKILVDPFSTGPQMPR